MATVSIDTTVRDQFGKGAARKIRRQGQIPAVVYSAGGAALSITIDPIDLELKFKRSGNPNTLVDIGIDGTQHLCLVREVQRHPVSRKIRHIDFYEVQQDQQISVSVSIELVGVPVGVSRGGKMQLIRRKMDVLCRPADIPATIQVDVTKVEIDEFIRASQVVAPDNCELIVPSNFNVMTVVGKRGAESEETEEEEA